MWIRIHSPVINIFVLLTHTGLLFQAKHYQKQCLKLVERLGLVDLGKKEECWTKKLNNYIKKTNYGHKKCCGAALLFHYQHTLLGR